MRKAIFESGRGKPHPRFFPRLAPAVFALAGLGACPGAVFGAEWAMAPSLQLKAQHDDNIFLTNDDPVSASGFTISPLITLSRQTAASTTNMEGRLIFNRYTDDEIDDPDVQTITLQSQATERRSTWGINSDLKRDTTTNTITGTLNEDDSGADKDIDANLVTVQVRRNRLDAAPFFNYRLTERDSVRLRYILQRTFYTDEPSSSLFDYKRQGVEASFLRSLARSDSVTATVNASNYKAPDAGTETDDYSAQGSWTHNYATDLRSKVSLGISTKSTKQGDERIDSTGSIFGLGLIKQYSELTSYNVQIGRRLRPSGAGVVVQSDSFDLDLSHAFSSRWSSSLAISAYKNRSLDFFSSSVDRVYYEIEPQLSWKITRFWYIDASYKYRWQKYDAEQDSADSNAVFLAIDYAWPKMAVSR
jgi:hypothetical protein